TAPPIARNAGYGALILRARAARTTAARSRTRMDSKAITAAPRASRADDCTRPLAATAATLPLPAGASDLTRRSRAAYDRPFPQPRRPAMKGLMQEVPLNIPSIVRHAERQHPRKTVATPTMEGVRVASFAVVLERARRLASALRGLGVGSDDRVATFCWNHQ